ncbi:hypothetical protein S7335_744 [Synechococcus sp. PCC 7335]|uniref:hypothetical protein n=1 Tax=Synechococcus sp. (strain ATCC 29403 / PCC 7335) TaxID=91464 RepID=UPI00017ED64F|nr:hypothetical protein [Synechococcus sp. PCC 7335]EDX83564.1 hypothetical protein S7335_744 [Synechococcus sp. PCC 7335]
MNKQDKDLSFFSWLLNYFKRLMVSSSSESPNKPTDQPADRSTDGLPYYQLRYLERCLKKDCEMEISRKKLEHCWQETLKYE